MLEAGKKAPDFSLPDSEGNIVKLGDLKGKRVVLYFYPKDDTPGCTVEACGFRDMEGDFEKRGAVILGISPEFSAHVMLFTPGAVLFRNRSALISKEHERKLVF